MVYNGNHKGLITINQFNQAQDILHNRQHPHPKKHFYSAQGFLKCENCGFTSADFEKYAKNTQ